MQTCCGYLAKEFITRCKFLYSTTYLVVSLCGERNVSGVVSFNIVVRAIRTYTFAIIWKSLPVEVVKENSIPF